MTPERDDRRERLRERLRSQRGRRARPEVQADVEALTGQRPSLDDFLSADTTDALAARYLEQSSGEAIQRQTWTTDLHGGVVAAVAALAESLEVVEVYWLHRLSQDAGAVRVPATAILRGLTFSAGDHDLVLVTHDAEDGLRLAWDRLPDGSEFELVRWGSFRD